MSFEVVVNDHAVTVLNWKKAACISATKDEIKWLVDQLRSDILAGDVADSDAHGSSPSLGSGSTDGMSTLSFDTQGSEDNPMKTTSQECEEDSAGSPGDDEVDEGVASCEDEMESPDAADVVAREVRAQIIDEKNLPTGCCFATSRNAFKVKVGGGEKKEFAVLKNDKNNVDLKRQRERCLHFFRTGEFIEQPSRRKMLTKVPLYARPHVPRQKGVRHVR